MSRRLQGILIGVIVGVFSAGGVAYAVTVVPSAPTDRWYACVNPMGKVNAGTLRLNVEPTGCGNDTVRSWSAQGPEGLPGPPGAAGPQGPQGAPGPAGLQPVQIEAWDVLPRPASGSAKILFADDLLTLKGECFGTTTGTPTFKVSIKGVDAPPDMGFAMEWRGPGFTGQWSSRLVNVFQSPWPSMTTELDGVITTGPTSEGGYHVQLFVSAFGNNNPDVAPGGSCNFRGMVIPQRQ
jgi:hypothetical protein